MTPRLYNPDMNYRKPVQFDEKLAPVWQKLKIGMIIAGLFAGGISPILSPSRAAGSHEPAHFLQSGTLPSLEEFSRSVSNGITDQIVGVYAPGLFALPIVQQPAGQPGYVSSKGETLTQFDLASDYDTVGLLAHNYLSGKEFFEFEKDHKVFLVYGDGSSLEYIIENVDSFQALTPSSAYSDFIDLKKPGEVQTANEVFDQIYGVGGRLVFQTCIEKNGNLSWGRLFVTAVPAQDVPAADKPSLSFTTTHREFAFN